MGGTVKTKAKTAKTQRHVQYDCGMVEQRRSRPRSLWTSACLHVGTAKRRYGRAVASTRRRDIVVDSDEINDMSFKARSSQVLHPTKHYL